MAGYGGCWTPEFLGAAAELDGGNFADVQASIGDIARRALRRPTASVSGSKEVFVEEFIPSLIASGTRVVVVVRDP